MVFLYFPTGAMRFLLYGRVFTIETRYFFAHEEFGEQEIESYAVLGGREIFH